MTKGSCCRLFTATVFCSANGCFRGSTTTNGSASKRLHLQAVDSSGIAHEAHIERTVQQCVYQAGRVQLAQLQIHLRIVPAIASQHPGQRREHARSYKAHRRECPPRRVRSSSLLKHRPPSCAACAAPAPAILLPRRSAGPRATCAERARGPAFLRACESAATAEVVRCAVEARRGRNAVLQQPR